MVYPLVNVINVEVNYVLSVYVVIMKIIVNSIYLFINFTRKDSLMKGMLSPLRILLTWLHFIHVQSYEQYTKTYFVLVEPYKCWIIFDKNIMYQ